MVSSSATDSVIGPQHKVGQGARVVPGFKRLHLSGPFIPVSVESPTVSLKCTPLASIRSPVEPHPKIRSCGIASRQNSAAFDDERRPQGNIVPLSQTLGVPVVTPPATGDTVTERFEQVGFNVLARLCEPSPAGIHVVHAHEQRRLARPRRDNGIRCRRLASTGWTVNQNDRMPRQLCGRRGDGSGIAGDARRLLSQ